MLTRGRRANHLYLEVVGDGDPHGLAHTDSVHLLTAVERLERALTHDDAPASASTQLRAQDDPTKLLAPAVARYTDALGVAAEQVLGREVGQRLDQAADNLVLWLTECPAWDTLRADLLGLAADGHDPVALLRRITRLGELNTARDAAAVLDHRLHLLIPDERTGPLPWLRGIPSKVAEDATWGPYLRARAERVEVLAQAVRDATIAGDVPLAWLRNPAGRLHLRRDDEVLVDISVWRAAMDVASSDRRPTGEPAMADGARGWQNDLDARLENLVGIEAGVWSRLLTWADSAIARDPDRLEVAQRLHQLETDGVCVAPVVKEALARGHLPADHAASALWYRVVGLLNSGRSFPPPAPRWETVEPRPIPRPESESAPWTISPDRGGPSIGF